MPPMNILPVTGDGTALRLADGQGPGIEFRIVPAAAGTSPEAYTLHIGDEGISDLAWALMNSPEFLFIQ